MRALDAIGHALAVAGTMTWEITWSLSLGFTVSAIVQALIRRQTITRLLGDDRPRTRALATGLGAVSSSCSRCWAGVVFPTAILQPRLGPDRWRGLPCGRLWIVRPRSSRGAGRSACGSQLRRCAPLGPVTCWSIVRASCWILGGSGT
jgi:hypothetical protein